MELLIVVRTLKTNQKLHHKGTLDHMKPIILKAGVPLVLSVAGFIFSIIATRRRWQIRKSSPQSPSEVDSQEEDQGSLHSLEELLATDAHIVDSLVSLRIRDRPGLEDEILGLNTIIRSLQDRESELEQRFTRYCDLKENELILSELKNMMELEHARAEHLEMMVESMEGENRRFEAMVLEYLRVLEQLSSADMENSLLKMKVKKLWRTTIKRSRISSQQASMLRIREAQVLLSHEGLEQKDQLIKDLQDENLELKRIVDRLHEEKKDLAETAELGEPAPSSSSTLQIKDEDSSISHQDSLLAELEQLRNVRVAEAEELICLRWMNACLRHEVMKNREQRQGGQVDSFELHDELACEDEHENIENNHGYDSDNLLMMVAENNNQMEIGAGINNHHKKPKLLQKLKKWVKGSEGNKRTCNLEDEDHPNKYCFRRHSVSDEQAAAEKHVAPRKSCASA